MFSATAQAEDGLTAEVYNVLGQNNAPVLPEGAEPVLVTQVPNVDFNWGSGNILGSTLREDVIVKLTGDFTPISTGTTYITAPADDGVKLYLDGQLYINDWYDKGGGGSTADVPTTQGVPMVIEMWYYENGGGANVKLMWYTDNGWQVIPPLAFVDASPVVSPTPEPLPVEPVVPVTPVVPEPTPTQTIPTVPQEPQYVAPVEPVPETPVPPVVEPEVIPEPEPSLEPTPEPQPEPEITPEILEPLQPEPPIEEPTEEPMVTLDNGVVLTETQATAVALLQNPGELIQELFTNPAAAFAALGSVGADMTPEVREQSEKVVIAAVIAGNIATTAATSAAGAAAIRRKP